MEEPEQNLQAPRYSHDCDHCEFMGRDGEYDMYYCASSTVGGGLVIACYGSGGEYASSLP